MIPGTVATAASRIVATSEEEVVPVPTSRHMAVVIAVHVHAALGGVWPRRQPLNVAVLLRPSGEMPVGECPGRRQRRRRQTAANGTTAALVLLLGVCLLAAAVADGGLCMALDF